MPLPARQVHHEKLPRAHHTTHRVGGWLPHKPAALKAFIARLIKKVNSRESNELTSPAVRDFQNLIERDASLYAGATLMIDQVPQKYQHDPSGGPRLTDYKQMCQLIDEVVQNPPPYNHTELVAFPINAILDWSMGTPAGWSFFLSRQVNNALQAILVEWGRYLSSADSLQAFTEEGGWMSPDALEKLHMERFDVPDPTGNSPAWGYPSWNDWFIREFKAGERPVHASDDPKVVVSACESTPYALQRDVQLRSTFWIKQQPYSLAFMMGCDGTNDPACNEQRAQMFVGGTVYQAFLSAFEYHRWHAPVDGTVRENYVVPGSYYAESPAVGFDEGGPNLSQGYISNVAARAVIFIEADDPVIGMMCVVAIGMAEVSSNIITTSKDTHVTKGQELGYFQFGGSTHCLVFQNGAIASWNENAIPSPTADIVQVNSFLARARDQ